MELGPDLFALLNAKQRVGDQKPVLYGQGGLSSPKLDHIQTELGFPLPSDFRYLLSNMQDDGGVFFPWDNFDKQKYDQKITWVLEGILGDVEESGDWIQRVGERPYPPAAAAAMVKTSFPSWPTLLPLVSHRFLPAQPCKAGNPVFSIVQTDIIYYGANLAEYLFNEFIRDEFRLSSEEIRPIPFWSDWCDEGWGQTQTNEG